MPISSPENEAPLRLPCPPYGLLWVCGHPHWEADLFLESHPAPLEHHSSSFLSLSLYLCFFNFPDTNPLFPDP